VSELGGFKEFYAVHAKIVAHTAKKLEENPLGRATNQAPNEQSRTTERPTGQGLASVSVDNNEMRRN
jgi:hypothetical protein